VKLEDLPRAYTRPHLELAHILSEDLGLRVELEFPIGTYMLDILVTEAWCGVEYDGLGHSQPAQIERDRNRDRQIMTLAGIPIIRITPDKLRERRDRPGELVAELCAFFNAWADTCEKRREIGAWTRR